MVGLVGWMSYNGHVLSLPPRGPCTRLCAVRGDKVSSPVRVNTLTLYKGLIDPSPALDTGRAVFSVFTSPSCAWPFGGSRGKGSNPDLDIVTSLLHGSSAIRHGIA